MPRPESGRPIPVELPPELAVYLGEQETACIPVGTDLGTSFVIKLPTTDIEAVRGPIPIIVQHQLYPHPSAPVLRHLFTFMDDPESPLTVGTYVNIDDPEQLSRTLALIDQEAISMFFYDEALAHTLTKLMPYSSQEDLAHLLEMAQELWLRIPREGYNFDAAKAALEERSIQ